MKKLLLFLSVFLIGGPSLVAQKRNKGKEIAQEQKVIKRFNGFFDFSYHTQDGKLILHLDKQLHLNKQLLYINSLSAGIGSNDIGLDRGQLGDERVVYFRQQGGKVFMVQPNLKYRSTSDNLLEQQSIQEAFASSVLFSFSVEKETATELWIDMTPFLLRDAHGVTQRLKSTGQGQYRLDKARSAISLARTRSFPKNSEFDVLLTFSGDAQGKWIRSVTPTPESVTVHQHHSFVELPEKEFKPRAFDPRSGAIPFSYYDYSTPVNTSTRKVFALRHRLEKKNPEAAVSEAVEPIIYYLDNGTPEPVRSALLEGGKWWNQAFEAAGYKDAFQLKILPDDADPLDVRYNVIQWVHRSTRGWSYGASVVDPRTGEILKGHVSLGSLRIRQDFMIAQALTHAPYATSEEDQAMLDLALARIRQLSAHEIGHTLGFAHNFAASTNGRASVMDYPHPTLDLKEGQIDYTNAYATGIGDWDKIAVQYAYNHYPEGTDEKAALSALLDKSVNDGYRFITDQDARPLGGSHPYAHLWDNGTSATAEFEKLMQIREIALKNFSLEQLKQGEPYSLLNDRLVPLYFLHRYQLEAVVKLLGGQEYSYGVKGGPVALVNAVSTVKQEKALQLLINALSPEALQLPKTLFSLLPPHAFGFPASRESFSKHTGPSFDALGIAETLSKTILKMILHPQRAARLVQQKALGQSTLGLESTLKELENQVFKTTYASPYAASLSQGVRTRYIAQLTQLAKTKNTAPQVRAIAYESLYGLHQWLKKQKQFPFQHYHLQQLEAYLNHPEAEVEINAPKIPDGSPIGSNLSCSGFYYGSKFN